MKLMLLAVCMSFCLALQAEAATLNMLSCCPGENTAAEARFVWHSDSDSCRLCCAKAHGATGAFTIAPSAKTKKPVAYRSDDVTYYKYEAAIDSLEPGTEYIYWIEAGGEKFPAQKFKTAGRSGCFNFLWLSDVHSHPNDSDKMKTVELLRQDAESRTASSGGIDLVLFSGDAVKYGSRYDNWQQWNGSPAVTNYTFAMVPGNKEYYYTGSSTFYDYYWYLAARNNPPNGPGTTNQEGCYWFLRDSVLFVGIDSLVHKGSRMALYGDKKEVLAAQTNWFDKVVASQRGKFRYIVAFQHDPWFVYAASKNSFDKSRGNYDAWRGVFDKHKVDLALSGDEHNYIRTKPLRGDAENAEGTIYMVAGQIEASNYSATITTDIAQYGNVNATKYFDCMGATDASCGAAWVEVRPDSLKVTEFWDKWQAPNYKEYDSVTIKPKDRGWMYEESGSDKWIEETSSTRFSTGKWSEPVAYRSDGTALIYNNVFTPYNASTGNVVTVETTAQFCECNKDDVLDATVQAAVRLSTNGCFQVWKGTGNGEWADVEAEGVKPVSGEEYTLRTTFDYARGMYGVEVKTGMAEFARLGEKANPARNAFPLAAETNCVSSIAFAGETYFTSLAGDCRYEAIGFQPGEITVGDAKVVLDAAKAAWLNARGGYADVSGRLAKVTAGEFETAWLCNLDLMDENASAKLKISSIKVNAGNVEVAVTLERTGAVAQNINGVLKFYGAPALDAFKAGAASPVASTTLVDDDFSQGNTATATFEKGGNAFFNAEIAGKHEE